MLAVVGALVGMQQGGGQTLYESGDSCRCLYLHGAASFSVRHDANRPFPQAER